MGDKRKQQVIDTRSQLCPLNARTAMMATSKSKFILGAFLIILIAASSLDAQSPGTGAIVGTVTDPDGAVLPRIDVTVVNQGTLASREVVTSTEGTFRCLTLASRHVFRLGSGHRVPTKSREFGPRSYQRNHDSRSETCDRQ